MIEDKFKEIAEKGPSTVSGIERTGLKIIGMRDRYVKLIVPLKGNVNHVGMMYAGTLFTLGEFPGGAIVMASFPPGKFAPIVKEVSIRFKKPVLTDATVEIELSEAEARRLEKEAIENGKADFETDLEIKDMGGQTVALVKGSYQIRPIPEGAGNPFK